jgi:nucleotide-binding universal stress UspA family protein
VSNTKLLIGYDGSNYADTAIDDLQRAGLPTEVEALVVTVGEAATVPPFASHELIEKALVGERVVSIVDHANRHASETLRQARELVLNAGARLTSYSPRWQIRGEVLAGTPASELVRRAQEWQADLIVVGSQGRSAIGRLILGSVSLEVAAEAHCSVRIGKRGPAQSDRHEPRIVIGLDGSPGAERAMCRVFEREWQHGTALRIVAVDDGLSAIKADGPIVPEKYSRAGMSTTTSRITHLANVSGLNVSAAIRKGDPYHVLLNEAREWNADCIVVGSSNIHKPQGVFSWTVSTELAAKAECSIEIVR